MNIIFNFRIIDWHKKEDFGVEYCFALFQFKERSLIQFSIDWYDYPAGPYVILYLGLHSFMDIVICCGKLGLCLEILANNWVKDSFGSDFEFPN